MKMNENRTSSEMEKKKKNYLGGKVVLLKLSPFSQIPRSDRVVQASRPQFGTVGRDIYARSTVRVSLELSD